MAKKKDWSEILNSHCYEILEQVFEGPPDILWFEIKGLFVEVIKEIGGEILDPPGAPVTVRLDGVVRGVFDEPDPNQKTAPYHILRVRELLLRVGVTPSSHPRRFLIWRY